MAERSSDWLGPGVGACVIDIEGPGSQDLVTFGPGRNAIWAYRNLHEWVV